MAEARAEARLAKRDEATMARTEHEKEFSLLGRAEARLRHATAEAAELGRIAKRLHDEIEGQRRGADRRASITGKLADEDRTKFLASTQRADELARRAKKLRKEQRKAEKRARIAMREIDPYSAASPNSHILDCLAFLDSQSPLVQHVPEGVEERLRA